MTFEKLFKVVTEAKNEQPGMRYHSAMNATGPASYVSGPIGKSDNFEVSKPIKKWDFDPSADVETMKGVKSANAAYNNMWKTLNNAFSILRNEPGFDDQVKKLASEYDKRRESYRNMILGVDEAPKAYDEESKLETLSRNLSKYQGEVETLRDDIRKYKRAIKWGSLGPGSREVLDLKNLETTLEGNIKNGNKFMKQKENSVAYGKLHQAYEKLKTEQKNLENFKKIPEGFSKDTKQKFEKAKFDIARTHVNIRELNTLINDKSLKKVKTVYDKVQKSLEDIKGVREKLGYIEGGPTQLGQYQDLLAKAESKLTKLTSMEETTLQEYNSLLHRLNQIGETNLENNDATIGMFVDYMLLTAKQISNSLQKDLDSYNIKVANNEPVWHEIPNTLAEKKQMADKLAMADVSENPILGYLDAVYRRLFEIPYGGSFFDPTTNTFIIPNDLVSSKDYQSNEHNKNTNITSIRDYNSLPFNKLMNIYANSSGKMSLVGTDLDIDPVRFKKNWDKFCAYIKEFPTSVYPKVNDQMKVIWDDPNTKDALLGVVKRMGLGNQSLETIITAINRDWVVKSRTGANSFQQLKSVIESETKNIRKNIENPETNSPIFSGVNNQSSLPNPVMRESTASFDEFYNKIINSITYDEDDLKISIMEVFKK